MEKKIWEGRSPVQNLMPARTYHSGIFVKIYPSSCDLYVHNKYGRFLSTASRSGSKTERNGYGTINGTERKFTEKFGSITGYLNGYRTVKKPFVSDHFNRSFPSQSRLLTVHF